MSRKFGITSSNRVQTPTHLEQYSPSIFQNEMTKTNSRILLITCSSAGQNPIRTVLRHKFVPKIGTKISP